MQYSPNNNDNINLSRCINLVIIPANNEVITFLCSDLNTSYIIEQPTAIFCPSSVPASLSPTPIFTATPLSTPVMSHNHNGCNVNEAIAILNDGAMILCSGQDRTYIIPGNIFCQPALPSATSASVTFTPSFTPTASISGLSIISTPASSLSSKTSTYSPFPSASVSSPSLSPSSQQSDDCNRDHGNGVPNGNCNGHDKKTPTASPSKTSVPSVPTSNKPVVIHQVNSNSLIPANDDNNVYHISGNAINVTVALGLGNNKVVIPQNCTMKILGFKSNATVSEQHDTLDISPTGITSFDQLRIESLIFAINDTFLRGRQLTIEPESTRVSFLEQQIILDNISPKAISQPDFIFSQPPSPTPYTTASTSSIMGPIIGGIAAGLVVVTAISITILCLGRTSAPTAPIMLAVGVSMIDEANASLDSPLHSQDITAEVMSELI